MDPRKKRMLKIRARMEQIAAYPTMTRAQENETDALYGVIHSSVRRVQAAPFHAYAGRPNRRCRPTFFPWPRERLFG